MKLQNALLDARVTRLRRTADGRILASFEYSHAGGETEDIAYDDVVCCTGFAFDTTPFAPDCRPGTVVDGRLPAMTPEFESTDVPGLYFAGTLTQSRDYKKTNSAFIHGFRYNARALGLILEQKLYGTPLPGASSRMTAGELGDRILHRLNRSSALWQQFGFIGDAVVLRGDLVTYFEDLPVPYVHGSNIGRSGRCVVVTLEFGSDRPDVFAVERSPDVAAASDSSFLHPVIRVFSGGVLVDEHHLLENLFGEWTHPRLHRRPLLEFLGSALEPTPGRRVARDSGDARVALYGSSPPCR